jgi:hypothetical protein
MKTFASVVVVLVSLGSAGFAAQPEPTLFEAFATSPNTITKFSREVGAIDSSDATAHATVLVIEDTADSTNRMRGVRFDLVHNTGSDQVYLDEGQLRSLKREVDLIERFNARVFETSSQNLSPGGTAVHGTESCWMPDPFERILCPEYRVGPDWSGLSIGTFDGWPFSFPDRGPADLIGLLDRAIAELDEHAAQ